VLREYVRVADSGRRHVPVAPGAPLAEFAAIAGDYPVFRVEPARVCGADAGERDVAGRVAGEG